MKNNTSLLDIRAEGDRTSYVHNGARGLTTVPLDSDLFTGRRIFIEGTISDDTANEFMKQMMYLAKTDEPIKIYINSCGGEVNAGLMMYDVITSSRVPLEMYCVGQAASMAAILFAAGDVGRRHILPHSRVMIHEVLLGSGIGGSATSISKISNSIMEVRNLVNSLLAKHTRKTVEEINDATSFDNIMNAEEAIAFGIADDITYNIFE